jgi:acetyl-CoA carboxylase biotin carboxyl carrier protein
MATTGGKRTSKNTPAGGRGKARADVETGGNSQGAQPMADLEFLRGLIDAIDNSGVDNIEINRSGTKIRISKTPSAVAVPVAAPRLQQNVAAPAARAAVAQPAGAAPAAPVAAEAAARSNLIDIKSPMVGTFYRAPAPEAPSYAEVGSHVTKGQTLCILEAMKLMNELESEVDGIVREILVDNADPVEYGQVLFRVEPAAR